MLRIVRRRIIITYAIQIISLNLFGKQNSTRVCTSVICAAKQYKTDAQSNAEFAARFVRY